ncbi:MAG: deoxyribose-phosphate aldolase [Minisyncoccales bacterium]
MFMKLQNLAQIIDQTFLKKDATLTELKRVCEEAKQYGFRGLCIFPKHTKLAKNFLKNSNLKVITLIDEPTGASLHRQRLALVKKAKKNGSDEVDVVMKIDYFKNERYTEVFQDLKEICRILPTKVIIGSGYLTDEEIKKASAMVEKAGAICVKTATLKDPLDNFELKEKAKHIRIMRASVKKILVKASGAIRTLADLKLMVEAGADIIGTSSGKEIVDESMGLKNFSLETWRKNE